MYRSAAVAGAAWLERRMRCGVALALGAPAVSRLAREIKLKWQADCCTTPMRSGVGSRVHIPLWQLDQR